MIYIVDDDQDVRDAMAWLLRSRRQLSDAFGSAEDFLSFVDQGRLDPEPSALLLDVRMPGMSGLALFERLAERGILSTLPVIFLTGHGDVPTAVEAIKRGAFDFCEKPFSDNALVDQIERALELSAASRAAMVDREGLARRCRELTDREREVMHLVADGLPNKLVADRLSISVRTVEVHRARVFDKMLVRSAVELANMLQKLK